MSRRHLLPPLTFGGALLMFVTLAAFGLWSQNGNVVQSIPPSIGLVICYWLTSLFYYDDSSGGDHWTDRGRP